MKGMCGKHDSTPSSFVVFLLFAFVALALPGFALDVPAKPAAWITDGAQLLTSEQQQALNQKCEDFYRASKAELLVMTFPSLDGEQPVDYTNRVVSHWNVKGDRIAIIFIFAKDRQMRIQVGYGLEGELTDAFTSDVYRNTLVPAFRAGDYYGGINAAVDRLAKKVAPNFAPAAAPATSTNAPAGMPRQLPPRDRSNDVSIGNIIPVIVVIIVVLFFILPLLRRRGCGCLGCMPFFPFGGFGGGGFGGGGWGGTTFGGGGGGGGGGWSVGGNWGGGGGSSFGGGGSGGGW